MIPKFREWDAEREDIMPGKGMSYGIREDYDDSFSIRFDHMEDLDIINKDGSIDRTVMISTGLKDKNGVEIYEGDIVKNERNELGNIKWSRGAFAYCDGISNYHLFSIGSGKTFEVVGNIYQHPHLLEE